MWNLLSFQSFLNQTAHGEHLKTTTPFKNVNAASKEGQLTDIKQETDKNGIKNWAQD
jgi:hypothetical protein